MTYFASKFSYGYKKYEWTAYTEADFLGAGACGLSIGCGDTFTMPGGASVCMSTYDNDRALSGEGFWNDTASDKTGQKTYIDGHAVGSQMYAESYHILKDQDGNSYYMIEIEVECHNAPGAGDDYFTFYGAVPPAGAELTVVKTCDADGKYIDYSCLGAGDKAPANTPPTFTNVPADGIICVDENTAFVIDLNASDDDGDAVCYEIVGGKDAKFFEIDAATGELTFKSAPDFEDPQDYCNDNTYDVKVKVSDGNGGDEIKALTVCVDDVDENTGGGSCTVIEAEDMSLCNYRVECRDNASGGEDIKLTSFKGHASTTWAGDDGEFDLTVTYMDESDGKGFIDIFVNGCFVDKIRLNQNDDGNGGAGSTFSDYTIENLDLSKGDVITLSGRGDCGEYARIDKITICNDEAPKPGAIEGRLFLDSDGDNLDVGEAEMGIGGVTVTLLDIDGNEVATAVTDVDGSYAFTGLVPGDYTVVFPTEVDGKVLVAKDAGTDDTIDSDANADGSTDTVTVVAGEKTTDVDAGVADPGTASLGDTVFLDANGNGLQDAGEAGVDGVSVKLYDATGTTELGSTTTAGGGAYSFAGLAAGTYVVGFELNDDYLFTAANAGDDALDSDADMVTGLTGPVTLAVGEENLTIDAGVVAEPAPTADDDAGRVCATEAVDIVLLDNDVDAEGNGLTVTTIEGTVVAAGDTVTLASGGVVTVGRDGSVSYDSAGATYGGITAEDLLIGTSASDSFSYTITDGSGDTSTAMVDVTICGAKNTIDTIEASLPTAGEFTVSLDLSSDGDFYTATLDGTGDVRFDGISFDVAYCVAAYEPISLDTDVPFEMYLADEDSIPAGLIGAPENLDMVNWLLNQDFGAMDNGDGTGETYTEAEIQGAIWGLTDDIVFVNESQGTGTQENAEEIYDMVLAAVDAEGFVPGDGDIVGIVLDPTAEAEAAGDIQPFIIGVDWDDLALICGC